MTVGIYKLVFKGTDKVYIGQSINSIERRYLQHLSTLARGEASPKLQEAYNTYGRPEVCILEECSSDLLNIREMHFIYEYNSFVLGFNSTIGGELAAPGTSNPNSVYSKISLLKTFRLLRDPTKTYEEISEVTKVSVPVIGRIARNTLHSWLHSKYPSIAKVIRNNLDLRYKYICLPSTEGAGYRVKSPDGKIHTIDIVADFCIRHGLTKGNLMPVLRMQRKSHRGWTLASEQGAK